MDISQGIYIGPNYEGLAFGDIIQIVELHAGDKMALVKAQGKNGRWNVPLATISHNELRTKAPALDRESVLLEGDRIVNGPRREAYGDPFTNHSLTAALWSSFFGFPFTAEQVCQANILQKMARSRHSYKRDNYVDVGGFAENADICAVAQGGEKPEPAKGGFACGPRE